MSERTCTHEFRREEVRASNEWNGLDFVEVDSAQTTLTVCFLGRAPLELTAGNFRLSGGRTAKDSVRITSIDLQPSPNPLFDDKVLLHLDKRGDFSTYRLTLSGVPNIDPRYASLSFSFKANCPSDLDCAAPAICPQPDYERPSIDYLAKDYATFRQLLLDRLALTCPGWTERHVPDLGVTLVEVLAYSADYLSYYQDAVATEAYLDTARRRPSVRRHARLVDYRLSEGCNARALVAVEVSTDLDLDAAKVSFTTAVRDSAPVEGRTSVRGFELQGVPPDAYETFEPVFPGRIRLWTGNNKLSIHTWGDRECCLRKGSTRAELRGILASVEQDPNPARKDDDGTPEIHLQPGDFLIFEEVIGPKTGNAADANPTRRHAVRLTSVATATDELLGIPLVAIEWGEEDALPFDLCLSAIGPAPECAYLQDISVVWANIVLADHGRTQPSEDLGAVPVRSSAQTCLCEGEPSEVTQSPGRYRPALQRAPLTFAAAVNGAQSATAILNPDPWKALPELHVSGPEGEWNVRYDLLGSGASDRHFVVEMEENGLANLRFGNGECGKAPLAGGFYSATYRTGNGPAGNVGASAISVLVHQTSALSNDILRVRNPIPAQGGAAAQPMEEVKLMAPSAFRFGDGALRRAITADDYATIAARHPKVQSAAARLVWTGSWFEAETGIDVKAAYADSSAAITTEVENYLEGFRRMGHDLDAQCGVKVPLELELQVCIAPEYLRGHVKAALLDAFSNRALPGGKFGFFHADQLVFGADIRLSAIIAAAHAVNGVVSVKVLRLQRQFEPSNHEIEDGLLPLGPFEIAQLDNSPNYPERGKLTIHVLGGR